MCFAGVIYTVLHVDGVPTQDSEGDKFGDPQSEHGRSGVSSVVSHISGNCYLHYSYTRLAMQCISVIDPSKDLLAESDLERVVHKQGIAIYWQHL